MPGARRSWRQTVGSGLLNLLQLAVVLRCSVILRDIGREPEALFLSNVFTLHQALLVVSSLKVEFSDHFKVAADRLPLLVLSGLAFAVVASPGVLAFIGIVDARYATYYATFFLVSAIVTATYHAFIARHRIVLATLVKGGPFLVAAPLIAAFGMPAPDFLTGATGLTAAGFAIAAGWAVRGGGGADLARRVMRSAWDLRLQSVVALANAFAINAIFVVVQWALEPRVALDYFEHLRLFVGPVTVTLFPIGQRIYAHVLEGDVAESVAGLRRPKLAAMVGVGAVGFLALGYPAYLVFADVTGLRFLESPSGFMYLFVLTTSVPRAVLGLWFPLVLKLEVHPTYLWVLLARIGTAVAAIVAIGELNYWVLGIIASAEVVGVAFVVHVIRRRLGAEARVE